MKRIVLAYSGGLDTSVAIPWLKDRYNADVIAMTMDLGQGKELEDVRNRALAAGAVRAHVLDVREEFASGYVVRALKADALYEDRYPMATSLGRPLIAKKLVELAAIEQAGAIAHGCAAEENDSFRLDSSARALDPALEVLAPVREWDMTRPQVIAYAGAHGIPVPAPESQYSVDANLWGRSIQCGVLDDPWTEPPEEVFTLTRSGSECPDQPAYVELTFERGAPTAINGVEMSMLELIASLGTIAGAHGVGRIDMVENRLVGSKSREIYEAPAAVVLHEAHKELQKMVVTREADRFSRLVSVQYADTIYNGLWFTPLRESLDAFFEKASETTTGEVTLRLYKGNIEPISRTSPYSLYSMKIASFTMGAEYDQKDARGFINLIGLPIQVRASVVKAPKKKKAAAK